MLKSLGHRIFDIPIRLVERYNLLFGLKKVLFGSILRCDTEFDIGLPDENYVTKYIRTCDFEK